ncbi:xanthine dehydrogenase family protein molybdopterin-binding subunit [Crocosphaera chwakensis]|uniref:Xanthine dehydrogenase n=1 Tax=Crocosphaera chwakensis CCY0110 TaxID=391612 RepID=A3IP63_9CHRO|nr:xanthine dehydrogenase family protein molybdopterin-binding subunit [Crocosphaera chwakensis]EAZ91628.1 Xanthine dehydrogenase [Crocosphaera chwakensis CCY0110]
MNRKDGTAKVTGTATYGAEHQIAGLVHGYLITANIASGKIVSINTETALKSPGVIKIITHENRPSIAEPTNNFMDSKIYEARLPLSDNQIHYGGQIIGLVVAETFEQARHAAHLVEVEYSSQPPDIDPEQVEFSDAPSMFGEDMTFKKGEFETGDLSDAMDQADIHITATYTTATELQAPMEPHAIIAHWEGNNALTVYEPSQWVVGSQQTYAELFDLSKEQVRIITPFIGGGFGSKAFPWSHAILCVAVARELQRPLKVVLSRRQMTANAGHRSQTEQTLSIGVKNDGTLLAIDHLAKSFTSPVDVFTEPCTGITPAMYRADNLRTRQELAVFNVGVPTFMRAPGENPGLWALESAMDELAWALDIDPVELRLKNETHQHQQKNLPFSAKAFSECLRVGVKEFGWFQEPRQVRSMSRDGQQIGWGMSASTFPALRGMATVTVRLLADGSAEVLTSANDMGTGCYTIVAGTASEILQLPVEQIQVKIGDSSLPNGGMAGGSQMTATLVPAVMSACQEVLKQAQKSTAIEALEYLKTSGQEAIEGTASSSPGEEGQKWAFQSWGAHFCEVSVDEEIARLRVKRWLSVMNVGRVMNPKTAASQVRGAIIMGIGHALMENCDFDPYLGLPTVYDLATYHYATHADVPRIEVIFVGEPDYNFNPAGVRGLGEIGITGVSAAIANAVYHATGKRIRDLPMTPDKLMINN